MFSLSSQSRIFIHALPTDMRKSFDALCGIIKGEFQKDIMEPLRIALRPERIYLACAADIEAE